jgi:hypothetical protein
MCATQHSIEDIATAHITGAGYVTRMVQKRNGTTLWSQQQPVKAACECGNNLADYIQMRAISRLPEQL